MAGLTPFPVYWFLACLLLTQCLSTDIYYGQRFVKTAPPPAGENQTQFMGVVSNATFDSQDFVIAKFLGIPFADPQPERFAKPELNEIQPDLINATRYKPICQQKKNNNGYQNGWQMSESCLYLNIFVPTNFSQHDLIVPTTTTTTTTTTMTTTTSITTTTTTKATTSTSTEIPATVSTGTTLTNSSTGAQNDAGEEEPSATNFEDALTLNSQKLAVFIYIYGGAFVQGNGNCYDATNLAHLGNIIVVTFNYRLGALGFLYTKDGAIPGNLGLWDQHTAIKWVKRYIHLFGGDPDRITVGGQSAGSYSSILQALYQPNDQLFHRVLAQSGTPVARSSVTPLGHETSVAVAKLLNCSLSQNPTGSEIKECLMKVPAQSLADMRPPVLLPSGLPIQPIIDRDFIKEDPAVYMSQALRIGSSKKSETPSHFARKDLLIGIDAEDGEIAHQLHELSLAKGDSVAAGLALRTPIDQERFRKLITEYFQDDFEDNIDDILVQSVVDRYTNWKMPHDNVSLSNQAVKLFTDLFFAIPTLDTASSHVQAKAQGSGTDVVSNARTAAALKSGDEQARAAADSIISQSASDPDGNSSTVTLKTYVYRFDLPERSNSLKSSMPWFEGTHHSAEVIYVFGRENNVKKVPGGLIASKQIVAYWTNFVKSGDPNNNGDDTTSGSGTPYPDLPEWKEYTEDEQYYLEFTFDPELPESKQRLVADRRHFWSDYIPRLRHRLSQSEEGGVGSPGQANCPKSSSNTGSRIAVNDLFITCLFVVIAFLWKQQT